MGNLKAVIIIISNSNFTQLLPEQLSKEGNLTYENLEVGSGPQTFLQTDSLQGFL